LNLLFFHGNLMKIIKEVTKLFRIDVSFTENRD
jgi:hypothetical protein